MSEANREEALWIKAFNLGATDAERTGCFIAYHRIMMKRVREGRAPPPFPGSAPKDNEDAEDLDLGSIIANGIAFAEALGVLPRSPRRKGP